MTTHSRVLSVGVTVAIGLGLPFVAPIMAQVPPTLDFHRQTDPADRAEVARLYDVASFDRQLNMVTHGLGVEAVHQLVGGAESGRPLVQTSALVLLASAVAQDAIPAGKALDEVSSAVATVAEGKDASAAADQVRVHARRVQWLLRVNSLADPAARATLLTPLLEQKGADGVYYAYASVDYLADLGADGERVLRAFAAEGAKRSIDPEIMGRVQLGLQKISLLRQVERAAPADAVTALVAAVRTPTKRQMDREFGKWVIRQLAMHRPEAESELRALFDDDRVPDEVQVAARFALTDGATTIRWR